MSIGGYLPHPLSALPDVLPAFHAFHVHTVLADVWRFMKDNVPSPVAFTAANSGDVPTREFENLKVKIINLCTEK